MDVPLNSTDTVRSKHTFVFASPSAAAEQMRPLYWRTYYPLAAAVAAGRGSHPGSSSPGRLLATVRPMDVCTYALRLARRPTAGSAAGGGSGSRGGARARSAATELEEVVLVPSEGEG